MLDDNSEFKEMHHIT